MDFALGAGLNVGFETKMGFEALLPASAYTYLEFRTKKLASKAVLVPTPKVEK